MALAEVGLMIDLGHVCVEWVSNPDSKSCAKELPKPGTLCVKCKEPWPCRVILKARRVPDQRRPSE